MEEHIKDAFYYTRFNKTVLDTNITKLFERNIYNKTIYKKNKI